MSVRTVGPGKQFSSPQAAIDDLLATVGITDYTEQHLISIFEGTYTSGGINRSMNPTSAFRLIVEAAPLNSPVVQGDNTVNVGQQLPKFTSVIGLEINSFRDGCFGLTRGAQDSVPDTGCRWIRCKGTFDDPSPSGAGGVLFITVDLGTADDVLVQDCEFTCIAISASIQALRVGGGLQTGGIIERNIIRGGLQFGGLNATIKNNFIRNVGSLEACRGKWDAVISRMIGNSFSASGARCVRQDAGASPEIRGFWRNNSFDNVAFQDGNLIDHANMDSDFNNFGGTSLVARSADITFADWQSVHNHDANGINSNPLYIDPANGDLHIPTNSPNVSKGVVVAGVTLDIDEETRASPPTIGADEVFIPAPTIVLLTGNTILEEKRTGNTIVEIKSTGEI